MLFTPGQRDRLLNDEPGSAAEASNTAQRERLQRALALDPVNRVSYLESRCYMLNTLLRDSDFMSMSQGLEIRVPLIDHQLAKAVLALPGNWKLNGTPKKLLVGALEGSLPDQIVHRPKRGFTLPFEHWMRQELRAAIQPVLESKRIDSGPLGGLLRGREVQQVWDDFVGGSLSWSRPWALYVLQRWCELHL
jgi:asparagine synthase (glutamine-hydrolysing)